MGLDMFLFRVKKGEKPTAKNTEEVAYWRKANMIRQWFVDNVDYPVNGNCVYHKVTKEELYRLADTCLSVLYMHTDDFAAAQLPTTAGFFFGDTEYDDCYYYSVSDTLRQVINILESIDFDEDDIYYYEWW